MKKKIRNFAKSLMGIINCKLNGITHYGKNVYIGKDFTLRAKKGKISIGSDVEINPHSVFLCVTSTAKITLGDNIRLSNYTRISSARNVIIENGVNVGPFVVITDHNHAYEDISIPIKDQDIEKNLPLDACVRIKEGTWIGTKVTVIGNHITIGKHCIIGANSVVTKDIPDYSVAAGAPCKVVKQYDFQTNEWKKVKVK